jgi:hypothetical protein
MAEVASCSTRSIKAIHSNLHYFGTTKAPSNGGGRPRSITPPMLDALCDHLLEKPGQYLDEMVVFLRAGSGAGTGILLAALPAAKTREAFAQEVISEQVCKIISDRNFRFAIGLSSTIEL